MAIICCVVTVPGPCCSSWVRVTNVFGMIKEVPYISWTCSFSCSCASKCSGVACWNAGNALPPVLFVASCSPR